VTGTSADRLKSLRRLLTVLFTAVNSAGLIVFAWLLIDADAENGKQRLDNEVRKVTMTIPRVLDYDGSIVTAHISSDPLNDRCPQFAVVPGGEKRFSRYVSRRQCVKVDDSMLDAFATEAVRARASIARYELGPDNRRLYAVAEPVRIWTGEYIGALVAVGDAEPESDRHQRVVLLVIGGCVALIVVLGLVGHALAGRAMRPAGAALREQEDMLAEISHDLRAPVAKLLALAETAQRNPAARAELLPRTVSLAKGMGAIIEGSLLRARLAAGVERLSFEPVWLDQLVEGVVEEMPLDGARVLVRTHPVKVAADPVLLRRAVGNLLVNAVRHGSRPGVETVVRVDVLGDGRVLVADHGPGVDPAVAGRMFDRFSSGGGSSGLGLAIVRWVALAHGGGLRVFNAESGGAVFELGLPVLS
jgi:signal transduction histidine kinase